MSGIDEQRAKPRHWLDEPRNIALLVLAQGTVFTGIGLAIWHFSGRGVDGFVRWRASDLAVALAMGGAMIGAMQGIAWAFPRFMAWAADRQRMLFAHGRCYRPIHIVILAVAAGVGEEALFRAASRPWPVIICRSGWRSWWSASSSPPSTSPRPESRPSSS